MFTGKQLRIWEILAAAGVAVAAIALLGWLAISDDLRQAEADILADANNFELQVTQNFAIAEAILASIGGPSPYADGAAGYDFGIVSTNITEAYPFISAVAWVTFKPGNEATETEDTARMRALHPNDTLKTVLVDDNGQVRPKLNEAVAQAIDYESAVGSDMIILPNGDIGFMIAKPILAPSEDIDTTSANAAQPGNAVALFLNADQFFQNDRTHLDHLSVWLLDLDATPDEARPLFLQERAATYSPFATKKVPVNIETAERSFWISAEAAPKISQLNHLRLLVAFIAPIIGAALALFLLRTHRRSRWKISDSAGKLSHLEQRLKDFADASVDWFWETDADLRFCYLSSRFTSTTGVPAETLLGKTRKEISVPNVDPEAWRRYLEDLENHRPYRDFTHQRTKPDGSTAWLSISGKPVFDENGKFEGYRGNGRDITERVKQDQAFAAAKIAAETAEAASRQKSEFLSNMSHELRTPLNSIIGFSQMMATSGDAMSATDRKEFCQDIQSSGTHLLSLVNDLLDFSKIESGNDVTANDHINIPETFSTLQRMFAKQMRDKAITLDVHTPDDGAYISADKRRFSQIFINLLSNAIKFSNDGGAVILSCALDDTGSYVFHVIDTGIGMTPEDLPRAFEKFCQIDTGHSRNYEGTGLGLPITKLLIENHGGTITAVSAVGSGTDFTIHFPPERTLTDAPKRTRRRKLSA